MMSLSLLIGNSRNQTFSIYIGPKFQGHEQVMKLKIQTFGSEKLKHKFWRNVWLDIKTHHIHKRLHLQEVESWVDITVIVRWHVAMKLFAGFRAVFLITGRLAVPARLCSLALRLRCHFPRQLAGTQEPTEIVCEECSESWGKGQHVYDVKVTWDNSPQHLTTQEL